MDLIKIGHFLAELRHEQKLTQEQLGEILCVTNKTVSRWETGNYLPPVEMLHILSEYYSVSINEILAGKRLTESVFTVKDKVEFFKKKWKKENLFSVIICLIVVSVLFTAGIILDNGLQIVAIIAALVIYLVQYNRMMAYVEKNAYDGTGKQ